MALPHASRVEDWLVELADRTNRETHRALAKAGAAEPVARGAFGAPTVAADKAAEQVIIDAMPSAPIPLNLFSEEAGHIPAKGAEWTLIADPIDGTRNALRRIPFYCVSLAVAKSSLADVELGVVRNAVTPDVYVARRGGGAWANGERVRVRPFDTKQIIVAAALDYEKQLRIEWQPHVHFRDLGSAALELCLVATGAIDLFLSTKPYLRIVDVAAATLMVQEAGGIVMDSQKKPLNAGFDVKERIAMYAMGDRRALDVMK